MTKLLFISPSPIQSASERYRIYQFLPILEQAGFSCTVFPFATTTLHRAIQQQRLTPKLLLTPLCYLRRFRQILSFSQFDLIVVHRGIFPFPWPALEQAVIRSHAKVLFDFDDSIHVGHQDVGTARYPWIYKLKYGSGVNAILKASTHVIAGNGTLAAHAKKFNPHVSIIPTVIDTDSYSYTPPRESSGVITIGWVGSRSTSPYLLAVEPALRKLSEVHGNNIRFRIFGHPDRCLELPNFDSLPFSLSTEIQDLRSLDIGIMPMPDNDWTRGKCAFKAIQYMSLGIPTVASPVGMTTELIEHNVNGVLANSTQEWFDALNRLVTSFQIRSNLADAARKTVVSNFSLQGWSPRLVELLRKVLLQTSPALAHTVSATN
jgi:glycosyltransferase involved in cell wall biosynthesis